MNTTLNMPFPIPLRAVAKRKNFAWVEILSGTNEFRSIS
jgi:hypothetical protein